MQNYKFISAYQWSKFWGVLQTSAILKKIYDCESYIKIKKEREKEVSLLTKEANTSIDKKNFDDALKTIEKILNIEKNNQDALTLRLRIYKEKSIGMLKEANLLFTNGDYKNAIPLYEKALEYDSTLKVCKSKIKGCKEKIEEIANLKEQDRLDYLNNKVRKLRELSAKCKAKQRKSELKECIAIISEFLEHTHSLGLDIYDDECKKMLSEYTTSKEKSTTPTNPNTTRENNKRKEVNTTSVVPQTETDSIPRTNNSTHHTEIAYKVTKKPSASELFKMMKFKDALEAFEKDGNSKMVELCGKLKRIQKRIEIRTKELEKTTFERAKPIVNELTEYMNIFKEHGLDVTVIENLIKKYKSIK